MGKFANPGRIPVQIEDDPHIIYIKAELTVDMRGALLDAVEATGGAKIGRYQTEQLLQFVTAWNGPDFEGVDCTPTAIRKLSHSDPLVQQVLQEIAARCPLDLIAAGAKAVGGRNSKASGNKPPDATIPPSS